MIYRLLGIACLMSCFLSGLSAQKLQDAEEALAEGDPETALSIIHQLRSSEKTLLLHAECRLALHQPSVAAALLSQLEEQSGRYHYLLGQSLHQRHEFSSAVASYKKYISASKLDEEDYQQVVQQITRCLSAINLQLARRDGYHIVRPGDSFNSSADDVALLHVPGTPDMLYFSSNRYGLETGMEFFLGMADTYDVLAMTAVRRVWSGPAKLDKSVNSPLAEYVLAVRDDELLLERRSYESSDVFLTTDRTGRSIEASRQEMDLPYDPAQGDTDLHFVDEDEIIFSSKRRGGKGGYDLYYSVLGAEGWSPAVNLGATVNSPYDERYASTDGDGLYFSSDRTSGPGGMDIYHAQRDEQTGNWLAPVVMPLPINSASDDIFYKPAGQHFHASVSSNRPGGAGGYDLYLIYDNEKSYMSSPAVQTDSLSAEDLVLQSMMAEPSQVAPTEKHEDEVDDLATTAATRNDSTTDPRENDEPVLDADKERAENTVKPSSSVNDQAGDAIPSPRPEAKDEIAANSDIKQSSVEMSTDMPSASAPEKKEYYVAPLYYRSLKDLANLENSTVVTELIAYMQHDSLAEVTLEAFARKGLDPETDLYFSTRPAIRIATQLTSAGIAEERVHVAGYGSAYPAMGYEQPTIDLEKHAQMVNSHVMIRISHAEVSDGPVYYVRAVDVPALTVPSSYDILQEDNSSLHYRVRFATTTGLYKDAILQTARDLVITVEGKEYHYHTGIYTTYQDAEVKARALRQQGYSDAVVIGFYGGAELSESRANKISKQYPELDDYVRRRY